MGASPLDRRDVAGQYWPHSSCQRREERATGGWSSRGFNWGGGGALWDSSVHQVGVKTEQDPDVVLYTDGYSKFQNSSSNLNHVFEKRT